MKRYRIGFDPYGLILFLLIMVPNFVWFGVPAPNDVLRDTSVTPLVDGIASVCQVLMIITLCLIIHRKAGKVVFRSKWIRVSILCCACYFVVWICYYQGLAGAFIIISLTVFPCLAFILYEIDRRNWISIFPTAAFSVLHLIHGIWNFIL